MIEIIERSTIETFPMEFDYNKNADSKKLTGDVPKTDEEIDFNLKQTGKYPLIYLNGVIIEDKDMRMFKLYNDLFIPSLELEFSDPTNKIIDEEYPGDDAIISVFKKSDEDGYMGIKMDFKITNFKTIKATSNDAVYFRIEAIVNVDDLYLMNFESFKGTSYNTLKDLATKMKLGFASNVKNTDDDMVWINPANYKFKFIQSIISNSYLADDTFLFGYIDYYYNLNYVDIESQLKEDISTQMTILDKSNVAKDAKTTEIPLILTNNPDRNNTNMYIEKYTIDNNSTSVNLMFCYRHMIRYYDKTADDIKMYALDNISDEGDNSNIILKGKDGKTNGLYENLINNEWMGKLDTDNVHKNYLHSQLQNKNNLKFLQKLKMTIRMKTPNYGLYRFQKVLVELYNLGKINTKEETSDVDVEKMTTDDQYDKNIIHKMSGEWLITAINYNFSTDDGNSQEITLVKRELTSKYTFPRKNK